MRVYSYRQQMEDEKVDHRQKHKRIEWHKKRVFVDEFAQQIQDEFLENSIEDLRTEKEQLQRQRILLTQTKQFLNCPRLLQLYQEYKETLAAKKQARNRQELLQKMYRQRNKNKKELLRQLTEAAKISTQVTQAANDIRKELETQCASQNLNLSSVLLVLSSPDLQDQT